MKRLVVLAVLLAVIVPLPTLAGGFDMGKVIAGIQVIKAFRNPSASELITLGNQLDEGLVNQYGTTTEGLARVQKVVSRLEPDSGKRPRARVLQSEELNAFSTPGHIYITDSLLGKLNDDELAGVMGHEIEHDRHGDVAKALKRARVIEGVGGALQLSGANNNIQTGIGIVSLLSVLKYSREQEYAADDAGQKRAVEAGYAPDGLADALRELNSKGGVEFLSTHPESSKRIARLEKLATEQKAGKVQTAAAPKDHLKKRRIEIDADQMRFEGNYGWWLRDNIAAMLRNRVEATGRVEVAVSGQDFDDVAATQDRVHDSGRYSKESRQQVSRGEMIAPTDHYKVTGVADISYKDRGANVTLSGQNIGASETVATASVKLVVEPIDIRTGLNGRGYEVRGEASRRVNGNIYGGGWSASGDAQSSSSNIETDLMEEAASRAVAQFVDEFAPEPLEVAAPAPAKQPIAKPQPSPQPDAGKVVNFILHIQPLAGEETESITVTLNTSVAAVEAADYILFLRGQDKPAKIIIDSVKDKEIWGTIASPRLCDLDLSQVTLVRLMKSDHIPNKPV